MRPTVDAAPNPPRPLATPALAAAVPSGHAWYHFRNDLEPATRAGFASPTVSIVDTFSSTRLQAGPLGVRDTGTTATYRSTRRVLVRP